MINNKDLFLECFDYPAKNIDSIARDTLNRVVLPRDRSIPNELLSSNTRLIEQISKYNNYNKNGDKSHNQEIISEIDKCLKTDGMNFCPFSQYLMVHDVTHEMYLSKLTYEEKEYIINCYILDRHELYLNREYSDIIFQVLTDNYSHKRKGPLGVEKLKKMFKLLQINKINNEVDIDNEQYFILPDSGDSRIFSKILEKNNINFEWRNNHQGKLPDALVKIKNNFFIIEHKILKESGGGQDKQITEIIDFISYGEREVFYVSFMDGILFNSLKNPRPGNKLSTIKNNILVNLSRCPYNYFVNEYGFKKLLESFL